MDIVLGGGGGGGGGGDGGSGIACGGFVGKEDKLVEEGGEVETEVAEARSGREAEDEATGY
jgi:hypothetical protein